MEGQAYFPGVEGATCEYGHPTNITIRVVQLGVNEAEYSTFGKVLEQDYTLDVWHTRSRFSRRGKDAQATAEKNGTG